VLLDKPFSLDELRAAVIHSRAALSPELGGVTPW
jgi:hypothetical protein